MAIPSFRKPGRTTANNPSAKKANAIGYSKRKSNSIKSKAGLNDLYEDNEPVKSRRGKVSLSLDRDEELGGYDSGADGEDGNGASGSSQWPKLIGLSDDDEILGSEDDEDIDSDEAFQESDNERFAGFSFRSSKAPNKPVGKRKAKKVGSTSNGKNVHFTEVDLDERQDEGGSGKRMEDGGAVAGTSSEEEEEEEGEDDEFIDILDVMDGRGEPDEGDDDAGSGENKGDKAESFAPSEPNTQSQHFNDDEGDVDDEGSDEEQDEDEDESEDELMISGEEDEGDEPTSALEALGEFVSGLETGSKRKADDADSQLAIPGSQAKRKRFLKDKTETVAEGEFRARPTESSKLTLDDLLTPLSAQPGASASLKKSTKPLASSNPKNQPLAAPLPQRSQEKLDREAAYEQTKQEVGKWTETMKRIKEAEHLSFPLQSQREGRPSNLELAAKFKPTTELENAVDKLLKSAKLREEDITKTEELMMNNLSVEEVAERRAQLSKMRDLMFRADVKAKRVAKIKSKTYRRIRKKEKEKLIEKLDATGDGLDVEEEMMKREVERARERATLKHKNTGKWAKAMRARGELDDDQRRDINEMLEKGERLRKKISGIGSDDEEEDSSEDDEADVGEAFAKVKAGAFEELAKIRGEGINGVNAGGEPRDAKSIFEMKFMKEAAARQNREVDKTIDDFQREMGDAMEGDSDPEREISTNEGPIEASTTSVERVGGRMVFKPGPQAQASLPPPPPSAISETSTLKSHDTRMISPVDELNIHNGSGPSVSRNTSNSSLSARPSAVIVEESNPWLQLGDSSSSKPARKKNEVVMGRDVSAAQKSEARMKAQLSKTAEGRERAEDDARVEIDESAILVVEDDAAAEGNGSSSKRGDAKSDKKKKKKGKQSKGKPDLNAAVDGESDSEGEVEEQERDLTKGKRVRAFEQKELVARAFAGDNVVKEFDALKRREIEADAPQEKDTTLPGWGAWGGTGAKKAPPKPHLIKKIAGVDPKSRADYNKAHVIISEKRDKKAAKYTVKDLPYPYTSMAQFEQSMSTPLGTEWNTRLGFQRGTLPKVVKKMGTVINPLEKLF